MLQKQGVPNSTFFSPLGTQQNHISLIDNILQNRHISQRNVFLDIRHHSRTSLNKTWQGTQLNPPHLQQIHLQQQSSRHILHPASVQQFRLPLSATICQPPSIRLNLSTSIPAVPHIFLQLRQYQNYFAWISHNSQIIPLLQEVLIIKRGSCLLRTMFHFLGILCNLVACF